MAFSSNYSQMEYMEKMMRHKEREMEERYRAMTNTYSPPEAEAPTAKAPSKPAHLNPKLLITKG